MKIEKNFLNQGKHEEDNDEKVYSIEEGRKIFTELLEGSKEMDDEDLNELYEESREVLSALEKTNYRDFIAMSGRAIEVYRAIGKQDIAQSLMNLNQRRFPK